MLTQWHAIGLVLPLLLLVLVWGRGRRSISVLIVAAVSFAAVEIGVDLQIQTIRERSLVAISSLPRESEVRRRFGLLHGISSLLLLGQLAAAAATVAMHED